MSDLDLLVLAIVGQRKRDADGLSDSLGEKLFERDSGLDYSIGRKAGFGDAQMNRHVRPAHRESPVGLNDL